MTEKETHHVCVCATRGPFTYVAHCLELDLVGEGRTKREAISRLHEVVRIQHQICQGRGLNSWASDFVHSEWRRLHQSLLGRPPERTEWPMEEYDRCAGPETVTLAVEIRKSHSFLRNGKPWPSEYPLIDLVEILRPQGISWEKRSSDHSCFFGHFPGYPDAPVLSYPLYTPPETPVRWYHLRSIACRYGVDGLLSDSGSRAGNKST